MSRNAKKARQLATAKAWSKQRKGGSKGPATTQKLNKKRNTWYAKKDGKLGVRERPVSPPVAEEAAA